MAIIPLSAKVLNQYENVNTTYGGSKAMKAQSRWYTMEDVIETIEANTPIAPYKVFTALLKQNGSTDYQNINIGAVGSVSTNLVIGVTYTITSNAGGIDFTNVGAPNNDPGTSFIATGEVPGNQPSGEGADLIFDNGAPVALILENTIGNIWLGYADTGLYSINSFDLFTESKTYTVIQLWGDDNVASRTGYVQKVSDSALYLHNKDYTGEFDLNKIGTSDFSTLTSIEIRVYN